MASSCQDSLYHELTDAERTEVHKEESANSKRGAPGGTGVACFRGVRRLQDFADKVLGKNEALCFCGTGLVLVCQGSQHPKNLIYSAGRDSSRVGLFGYNCFTLVKEIKIYINVLFEFNNR